MCVALIVAAAASAAPADANAGKAVAGLKLVLKIDKAAYEEGEAWTGSVTATNESGKAFAVDTMSGGAVKFIPVDGKEPKIVMHIGTGRGKDTGEKLAFPAIEPGKSLLAAKFDPSPQPENVLATSVGGAMTAWDAITGKYRMVFTYTMTTETAKALGMESPWTGTVESNVATITVTPKRAKVTPVEGLALYMDTRVVGEGADQLVGGRMRLVNVSDRPITIDGRAPLKVEFLKPDGAAMKGQVLPIPIAEMAERTVTVKPGDWLTLGKYSVFKGATMVMANPATAYGLPVGEYTVKASYAAAPAADAKEKLWAGTLQSNEEKIAVAVSTAPAAK
jgi:hypothetical protein